MKHIPLRDFQLKANDYLDQLPIALTRYSHVVAIVSPPQEDEKVADIKAQLKNIKPRTASEVKPKVEPLPEATKPVISSFHLAPFTLNRNFNVWVCPHQNESGQCILGCVRTEKELI